MSTTSLWYAVTDMCRYWSGRTVPEDVREMLVSELLKPRTSAELANIVLLGMLCQHSTGGHELAMAYVVTAMTARGRKRLCRLIEMLNMRPREVFGIGTLALKRLYPHHPKLFRKLWQRHIQDPLMHLIPSHILAEWCVALGTDFSQFRSTTTLSIVDRFMAKHNLFPPNAPRNLPGDFSLMAYNRLMFEKIFRAAHEEQQEGFTGRWLCRDVVDQIGQYFPRPVFTDYPFPCNVYWNPGHGKKRRLVADVWSSRYAYCRK